GFNGQVSVSSFFNSGGAPPPRADALAAFLSARGAPPPLTSLAHSHSLEPRALRSGISRTERRSSSSCPRADALAAFLNACGAPPPLTSLAHSHSLEPRALRSGVSRTERRRSCSVSSAPAHPASPAAHPVAASSNISPLGRTARSACHSADRRS